MSFIDQNPRDVERYIVPFDITSERGTDSVFAL